MEHEPVSMKNSRTCGANAHQIYLSWACKRAALYDQAAWRHPSQAARPPPALPDDAVRQIRCLPVHKRRKSENVFNKENFDRDRRTEVNTCPMTGDEQNKSVGS